MREVSPTKASDVLGESPEDASAADDSAPGSASRAERRAWSTPRLKRWGDVRSLTLGGSPGGGDSGNIFVEQPFN